MSTQLNLQSGIGTVVTIPGRGRTLTQGTTKPADGATGYANKCLFQDIDAGAGATGLYINDGSRSSALFIPINSDPSSVASGFVDVPLATFREVDASGDVGDTTANGGVLSSNTTPIYLGDAAEALAISWAATNVDPVASGISLPPDFDASSACYLDLRVKMGGATDVPSVTVETSSDGAAKVTDTAAGSASASIQTLTATIAAGDIPSGTVALTIGLTPAAHGNDAMNLYAARLRYRRKALTT